jgi:uncharacterized protein YegJ (DUF2314 family)
MKRIVSAVSLLAIVLALGWHFRLHEELLSRLRPATVTRAKTPDAPAAPREPAPVEARSENAAFQLALYYLPKATKPARPALDALLPRYPALRLAASKDDTVATVRIATIPLAEYRPPTVDSLKYSGRGLSEAQAEALQKCDEHLVLEFRYRPADGYAVLREAHELLLAVASETGGLLWDEETRELFTPEAWKERRLDPWKGPRPVAPTQFTIHLYRNDDLLRAITLGMAKLGLPDLVVEDLPASSSDSVGSLINLAAQTLLEKRRLDAPGRLHLDVAALEDDSERERLAKTYEKDATGQADLTLVAGTRDEGDPANRLWEIDFPLAGHATRLEAQNAFIMGLFGATDEISYIQHDEELLAASRKAKEEFPRLAALARKGFAPGERLLLKAPFKTDDGGNEWMWVEVVTWKGDLVNGVLQNDPYEVSGLAAGARVEFRASDAFDYTHYHPDGREEGNGTGEILRRREEKPTPDETKK